MQHKNQKCLKKDKDSTDAEEQCVDEFIKLTGINSWPPFCGNLLFVHIVENSFGKFTERGFYDGYTTCFLIYSNWFLSIKISLSC